jgi:hypothetical protein
MSIKARAYIHDSRSFSVLLSLHAALSRTRVKISCFGCVLLFYYCRKLRIRFQNRNRTLTFLIIQLRLAVHVRLYAALELLKFHAFSLSRFTAIVSVVWSWSCSMLLRFNCFWALTVSKYSMEMRKWIWKMTKMKRFLPLQAWHHRKVDSVLLQHRSIYRWKTWRFAECYERQLFLRSI